MLTVLITIRISVQLCQGWATTAAAVSFTRSQREVTIAHLLCCHPENVGKASTVVELDLVHSSILCAFLNLNKVCKKVCAPDRSKEV